MIELPALLPAQEQRRITIYETATGTIRRVVHGEVDPQMQCAADESFCMGAHPLHGCRINLTTQQAEDYVPTLPEPDAEWDASARQFRLSTVGQRRRDAKLRIKQLEDDAQGRALRELALGDQSALARLQAIDDEIKDKRRDL